MPASRRAIKHEREFLVAIAALSVTLSCGQPDIEPDFLATQRDSAGVILVDNPGSAGGFDSVWAINPQPVISIGGANGDASVATVLDAARLPDGRLAVLSGTTREILIFEGNRLVRRIGRPGLGPGEFSDPLAMQVTDDGDTLRVWERHYGPITSYDSTGRYLGRRELDLHRTFAAIGSTRRESMVPGPNMTFLVPIPEPADRPPEPGALRRGFVRIVLVDTNYTGRELGRYLATEVLDYKIGNINYPLIPMFPHVNAVAVSGRPPRVFLSSGDRYEIDVYDSHGRLERRIRRASGRVPLDRRVLDSVGDMHVSLNARNDRGKAQMREQLAALPVQTHFPAVMRLYADRVERLWVKESIDQYSLFDQSGILISTLRIPAFRILDAGTDYVLALSRDEDHVDVLTLYRLEKRGPSVPPA